MKKIAFLCTAILISLYNASLTNAAVVSEYALNRYDDHTLSRAEKKCIEEGYKITYADCDNQTAPTDRCPHHDTYYRSCSQEQWCRNNNYTFFKDDCKLPSYPQKLCDNKFEIYRACEKDAPKACKDQGFSSANECQLSDQRCEFDSNYGKCCDECIDFPYALNDIPEGYVAEGKTCTTCGGIVKTKVSEASCEGFINCQYGPAYSQTPHCIRGKTILFQECKSPEALCREKDYTNSECSETEDTEDCPEFPDLKKCHTNCYKYAQKIYSNSDLITDDVVNPELNEEKSELRSLFGQIAQECISKKIPVVTLNLNKNNFEQYRGLFKRNIKNIDFILNFEEQLTLEAQGTWENVRIKINGTPAPCAFSGENIKIIGKVSLNGTGNLCSNVEISDMSKFTASQNIIGNITMGSNSQLGIKGDLFGSLRSAAYCEIFIKGKIDYKNKQSNSPEAEGITFGCNNQVKVMGGISAETANIWIKSYAMIDTPYINIISQGLADSGAASLHILKYAKITHVLDSSEYMLTDNTSDVGGNCDDKYIEHRASELEGGTTIMSLNTADSLDGKWSCRELNKQKMRCN